MASDRPKGYGERRRDPAACGHPPRSAIGGNFLFIFNPVFTRIVNDCVTVLGTNNKARLPGR